MNRDTRTFLVGIIITTIGFFLLGMKMDKYYDQGFLIWYDWIFAMSNIWLVFYGYSKISKTTD